MSVNTFPLQVFDFGVSLSAIFLMLRSLFIGVTTIRHAKIKFFRIFPISFLAK